MKNVISINIPHNNLELFYGELLKNKIKKFGYIKSFGDVYWNKKLLYGRRFYQLDIDNFNMILFNIVHDDFINIHENLAKILNIRENKMIANDI